MTQAPPEATALPVATGEERSYKRFDLSQRIEHFFLLISFTILGITGLAQRYAESIAGQTVLSWFGGIEMARVVHRGAAIVLMSVSVYHLIAVLYRVFVLRYSFSIVPDLNDFKHVYQDVLYYLGLGKRKAYYGRYSYAEKAEYFAVVWGTLIMIITGFMMWNPIATTNWLPGEWIPAAIAAHSGEALLAVLAIILWHFYHVHLRHFNRSIFTGKLTEEEMEEEHPAELAQIKHGEAQKRPPREVIRRRERYFLPVAAVVTIALGFGLYDFVTFEQTAIAYVPPGETAPVFVPFTPTPSPVPTATPTPNPEPPVVENTWDGRFADLFAERCGACHIQSNLGGLSLETYEAALEGGDDGPAIVPGNPDASLLVQIQGSGNHPGQLTIDELQDVIDWIQAGALEQ